MLPARQGTSPGGGSVESYIVRIYRRGRSSRRPLIGVVEQPGTDVKRAFTTPDELWDILVGWRGRDLVRRPPRLRRPER